MIAIATLLVAFPAGFGLVMLGHWVAARRRTNSAYAPPRPSHLVSQGP